MKINEFVTESTTAGAIATVASPMTTQSRNASIYGGKKAGNLLTGKKTNKKYANSVNESKMKELAMDIRDMDNGNFQKKYKKSKEHMKFLLGDPEAKKTVHEADLQEDDLIIVPGQGHKLKSGFIPHDQDRRDHEVEMARGDLFQAYQNAEKIYKLIKDLTEDDGLEGWVQAKITKAADYLNSVRQYLEGKHVQEMTGGVIAGGGVGEGLDEEGKGLWANIHAKRERIKKGSGERMRKPGSKGAPSAQDFKDAANEGIVDKIKGAVRREKAKDLPLLQTRRDYAMTKAGGAYEKGELRKGDQYSAWAERDRKKHGDPSDNPAGTYRTKASDYSKGK